MRSPSRSRDEAGWRLLRSAWVAVAWLSLLVGRVASAAEAETSKEYQIKAAFVYNFTKFVDWPASSFPEKTTPIVIGVLGTNPFGAELNKAVEGRRVNGREILIRPVSTAAEVSSVNAVFISASEAGRLKELLSSLKAKPVLTIGEKESFTREGGTIAFVLDGDKVRFAINMDSAEAAGIRVSAQLQKLAASVQKKP